MLLTSEIPGIPHEDDKAERHGRDVLLLNQFKLKFKTNSFVI